MNFSHSAMLPLFSPSASTMMPSFWSCGPCSSSPPSLFSNPSFPLFPSPYSSEIPLIITPNPVPLQIPSSPTSSSPTSDHRSSASLPLRSASFDLSNLVFKARWRREHFGEYLECAFCKSNGESYEIYSSHRLRDNEKSITLCPILRAHTCPRCQASGDQAHTMKYCPVKAETKANRRLREIQLAMKKD